MLPQEGSETGARSIWLAVASGDSDACRNETNCVPIVTMAEQVPEGAPRQFSEDFRSRWATIQPTSLTAKASNALEPEFSGQTLSTELFPVKIIRRATNWMQRVCIPVFPLNVSCWLGK